MLGATALAFYALLGFEDSVNLAEETQKPRRDFPRALFGGLAIAGLIYLGVAFTTSMLVDTETLAGSTGPLLEVVKVAGLTFPPGLFAVIALLAVTNTALINMIMASRLVYGMSNEGIVPKVLGRVHQRPPDARTSPSRSPLLIALTLVSTGDLSGLADTTVLLLLLVFVVVNISVLVLRREPDDEPAEGDDGPLVPRPDVGAGGRRAGVAGAGVAADRPRRRRVRARGLLLGVGVVLYVINRLVVGKVEPDPAKLEG